MVILSHTLVGRQQFGGDRSSFAIACVHLHNWHNQHKPFAVRLNAGHLHNWHNQFAAVCSRIECGTAASADYPALSDPCLLLSPPPYSPHPPPPPLSFLSHSDLFSNSTHLLLYFQPGYSGWHDTNGLRLYYHLVE